MYSQSWMIIRDDAKRTFEVCGQSANTNAFTNSLHAMQKIGMNISGSTPNVTNKNASKDSIKITGYLKEEGLHKRLMDQFTKITRDSVDEW